MSCFEQYRCGTSPRTGRAYIYTLELQSIKFETKAHLQCCVNTPRHPFDIPPIKSIAYTISADLVPKHNGSPFANYARESSDFDSIAFNGRICGITHTGSPPPSSFVERDVINRLRDFSKVEAGVGVGVRIRRCS